MRKAVRAFAAWWCRRFTLGKFLTYVKARVLFGRKLQSQRCPTCVSERLIALSWDFNITMGRAGPMAVISPLWVQPTAEESPSCGSIHFLSAGSTHAHQNFLDHVFLHSRSLSQVTKRKYLFGQESATGRFSWTRGGLSMNQQALAPAKMWKSGRSHLNFVYFGLTKGDLVHNRRFGTQRSDQVPNTSQWNQQRSSRQSARTPKTKSVTPFSLLSAPKQSGNTGATCRGVC